MSGETRRIRPRWRFRRIALVLSGGGALGAYEVGVFRVLKALDLRPAIIAGVSVGAINAVAWVSHGFRTEMLEKTWRELKAASIGMRWVTLGLRAAGGIAVIIATFEILLAFMGSPEVSLAPPRASWGVWGYESTVLECIAWAVVGLIGYALSISSPQIEDLLERHMTPGTSDRVQLGLGIGLLLGSGLYAFMLLRGSLWPWRFHVVVLIVGFLVWLANRRWRPRSWLRNLYLRLMPETRGRGLWRGGARKHLIESLVAMGDDTRLVDGTVHLIVSACAVDNGRMNYFVNWADPSREFVSRIEEALGEVVEVLRPRDVIGAVVAACAVPVLFEPARFRGREYLDGGVFSNQPLHAVVADGADAILLVLVSPSSGPRKPGREANLFELGARLQELANWRDLQTELRQLPAGWSREGNPARVCVVEPDKPLPGSLFTFDSANAVELMTRGERDAWRALEEAGWIEPE